MNDLNERAQRLGYEIVEEEILPRSKAGTSFRMNMGGRALWRIYRDGAPVFKFSWSEPEISGWLLAREREARDARAQDAA